jgi:4-nitrophenyl phosphatase
MNLRDLGAFAFDLDGTLWAGESLLPGAGAFVAAVREAGRPVVFLSNNSRHGSVELAARLTRLGIPAEPAEMIAALDLLGEAIHGRMGASRVLPLGTAALHRTLEAAGHALVRPEDWAEAQAIALGNDPGFDYAKLRAAGRAVLAGAEFFTCNLDARLPVGEAGEVDPGCGALAEAIAVTSGTRPVVVGKPNAPMFDLALERLGCPPAEVAMVGDNPDTDMAGGRSAGMVTVQVGSAGGYEKTDRADLQVADVRELYALWDGGGPSG